MVEPAYASFLAVLAACDQSVSRDVSNVCVGKTGNDLSINKKSY